MALQARIARELDDNDASSEAPGSASDTGQSSMTVPEGDPFLLDFDTDKFELDADTADQALGLLIVVSNLA